MTNLQYELIALYQANKNQPHGLYGIFNDYLCVSIKKTRVICVCKNKACKHAWSLEYRKCISAHASRDHKGYMVSSQFTYERVQDGRTYGIYNDPQVCPQCGRGEPIRNMVNGTLNDNHKCNAKCLNATGPNCDCSCAGANHGANH